MNRFFLLLCSGLLPITCQADSILHELEGVWLGSGLQDDGSQWAIEITISPNRYLVNYPSLNCGGELKLSKVNHNSLVFTEVLTHGLDGCYDKGKTILIKEKNMTRYRWRYEKGSWGAFATLTRQVLPPKKKHLKVVLKSTAIKVNR